MKATERNFKRVSDSEIIYRNCNYKAITNEPVARTHEHCTVDGREITVSDNECCNFCAPYTYVYNNYKVTITTKWTPVKATSGDQPKGMPTMYDGTILNTTTNATTAIDFRNISFIKTKIGCTFSQKGERTLEVIDTDDKAREYVARWSVKFRKSLNDAKGLLKAVGIENSDPMFVRVIRKFDATAMKYATAKVDEAKRAAEDAKARAAEDAKAKKAAEDAKAKGKKFQDLAKENEDLATQLAQLQAQFALLMETQKRMLEKQ